MASDWRDWEAGRTGVSVAGLQDGESMAVQIIDSPYREDTQESQDALHVPIVPMNYPEGFTDMSGEVLEEGDEYNIINSSSGFFNALLDAFPEGENPEGQIVEITAHQPTNEAYSRFYDIEVQ